MEFCLTQVISHYELKLCSKDSLTKPDIQQQNAKKCKSSLLVTTIGCENVKRKLGVKTFCK